MLPFLFMFNSVASENDEFPQNYNNNYVQYFICFECSEDKLKACNFSETEFGYYWTGVGKTLVYVYGNNVVVSDLDALQQKLKQGNIDQENLQFPAYLFVKGRSLSSTQVSELKNKKVANWVDRLLWVEVFYIDIKRSQIKLTEMIDFLKGANGDVGSFEVSHEGFSTLGIQCAFLFCRRADEKKNARLLTVMSNTPEFRKVKDAFEQEFMPEKKHQSNCDNVLENADKSGKRNTDLSAFIMSSAIVAAGAIFFLS